MSLPHAIVMSQTGSIHAGIPDLSITWNGKTSWWEVKLGKPTIKVRGVQEFMMNRLAKEGLAYYIIYQVIRGKKRTGIVHPSEFNQPEEGEWTDKFNHAFVADFVRRIHSPLDTSFKS